MRKATVLIIVLGIVLLGAGVMAAFSKGGGGEGVPGDVVRGGMSSSADSSSGAPQAAGDGSESALKAVPAPAYGSSPQYGGVGGQGGTSSASDLPSVIDRKIVRNATLQLTVDDVQAAAKQVEDAALATGGFVSASNMTVETLPKPEGSAPDEPAPKRQTATVTIRVPAEAYASVMSQIRGIAKEVTSDTSSASEVTEEYTDLQSRLRNLQSIEQRYLELLGRAEAVQDILSVQDRLNTTRAEIEQVQGRINLLNDLTDLATITVNLAPPPLPDQVQEAKAQPGWAEDAWNEAWDASADVLRGVGRVAITAGVVLIWLGIPVVIFLGLAWRFWGGRGARKESA